MKIAVKEGGTGSTSTSQSAAAVNLDSMLTVEDLCAVLKGGSSGSYDNRFYKKEQQSPSILFHLFD